MGLMDIVKKLLTGATDEENARNKARMRELFNECVPEGDQYLLSGNSSSRDCNFGIDRIRSVG